MMRFLRRLLGRESRHAEIVIRAQRTNEMLAALSGRQQVVKRQTQRIRRTGDPISKIYAGQYPQEEDQS